MLFLQPILLWGLAGIGIPILIHLLNRFRTPEMRWAAMSLLSEVVVARSRRIKIEDFFLLILRCLALALLALALARPVWPNYQFGGRAASGSAHGTVIALDGSYSMGCRAGVSARFERGVKMVRDVLKDVPPGTQLTVLLMGRKPHLIYKSLNCNPQEASALLDKAACLPEGLAVEANLESALAALREMDAPREFYLVTDAQKKDWSSLTPEARRRLDAAAELSRLYLLPCGDNGKENLALTSLRPLSGHLIKGELIRVVAEVWNPGAQTQDNVKVQLMLEDTVVDEKIVNVAAQQICPVFLYARLNQSGPLRLAARLPEDALEADNTRFAAVRVRDNMKLLCVDGGGEALESRYLAVALAPAHGRSGAGALEVERVSKTQLAGARLSDYQSIVLANVSELPAAQLNALREYVSWGGGLLIFVGGQMKAKQTNLSFGQAGLLPGELQEPVGDPVKQEESWSLEIAEGNGRFSQNLAALPKEVLAEPLFYRHFPIKLAPGAREILRFENKGGPLLAELELGRGKILFFNCSADDEWTSLPKTMFFPVLLHQAVAELAGQDSEQACLVGEPLNATLPLESAADEVVITDPKGEKSPLKVFVAEGRRKVVYDRTAWPGFYTIQPVNKGAQEKSAPVVKLAVNINTAESDVACLQGDALAAALKGAPVQIVEGDLSSRAQTLQQARTGLPLWWPLLIAALAVFLLEFWVAYHCSRSKGVTP